MRIEQTQEVDSLMEILSAEGVAEFIGDDGGAIELPSHPAIYYFLVKDEIGVDPGMIEDKVIGCMAFMPVNQITWNPHLAILPESRGKGTEAMKAGIDWMFENTPCMKIVAFPPAFNKPMIRVFEKCDFQHEGFSPACIRKDGVLHGRFMMGRAK